MRYFLSILFCLVFLFGTPLLAAEDEAEAEEKEPTQVAYHALKPSLVANVKGGARYIRCDVQLMTKDEKQIETIALHTPALRHELLMVFSEQDGDQLKTPKGKESLRKTSLKAVQARLKEISGEALVDDLFFTAIFVQ